LDGHIFYGTGKRSQLGERQVMHRCMTQDNALVQLPTFHWMCCYSVPTLSTVPTAESN
jgi:hypothetical protein